jgi:VanZ family protein
VSGGRVCRGAALTTAVCRVALLGIILVLIVIAYFPFAWSPPRTVRNQVARNAEGSLRFGQMNYARTSGTPAWLNDVRTSGMIQIQLVASPQSLRQDASIMMLASDYWDTDIAIGQDHSDLVVWLRRPGSNANGDPPFVIRGVLQPQRWTSVDLRLLRGDLRINVGARTRLTEHLPADSLQAWGQGQIALGDEVHGGGPWQGQVRLAQVRTPGHAVDYVRPGALSIPASYLYLPDHIESFPPKDLKSWLTVFLHMLTFIPVGFLIVLARRPPVRPVLATLLAATLALALAAGKFLFYGRHAAMADIVAESAGGLLGAVLAWQLTHVNHSTGRPLTVDGIARLEG